jgi:Rogdi leucine zipper containing protein
MGEVFMWRGREEVNVREKVRVESGDPSLISVAAKLSALSHEVRRWRENLRVLMGQDEDEDED